MEDELVQLESFYLDPGFLLLATNDDGERLGCVGARATSDVRQCEVRRMFIRPEGRGKGLGRALTDRLIVEAAEAGFTHLVLNTLPAMSEAICLYESMGFVRCDPYVDEPLEGVLYYSLTLE
jgi:putative acetyltransferase